MKTFYTEATGFAKEYQLQIEANLPGMQTRGTDYREEALTAQEQISTETKQASDTSVRLNTDNGDCFPLSKIPK